MVLRIYYKIDAGYMKWSMWTGSRVEPAHTGSKDAEKWTRTDCSKWEVKTSRHTSEVKNEPQERNVLLQCMSNEHTKWNGVGQGQSKPQL